MKNILGVLTAILFILGCAFGQDSPTKPVREDNHRFGKAEYLPATATGQKKAAPPVKGTLVFDAQRRYVDFQQDSGSPALSIKFDDIKSMTYEKASKPRMTEAVLISPLFLLSNSKKHYLTFEYTDESGQGKYAIIHLDKKNAREAVACAEAQTGKKVEQIDEK